jgi:hypothetical protein
MLLDFRPGTVLVPMAEAGFLGFLRGLPEE